MWYTPYLRVRGAVTIYAYFAIGLSLTAIAIHAWPGAVHIDARHQAALALVHIDLSNIIGASAVIVGGFATLLGLNLAAENDGHLEVAWTRPVSREGYALGVFAVDIAAMVASMLLTIVCGAVVSDVYTGHQAVTVDANEELLKTLAFCGFPLCIYGWITALSASLKRNRGAVAGLFWPLMFGIIALQLVPVPAIHAVASAINVVNPVAIYHTSGGGSPQPSIWAYLWGWVIAVLLLAAALVQWRRLEI